MSEGEGSQGLWSQIKGVFSEKEKNTDDLFIEEFKIWLQKDKNKPIIEKVKLQDEDPSNRVIDLYLLFLEKSNKIKGQKGTSEYEKAKTDLSIKFRNEFGNKLNDFNKYISYREEEGYQTNVDPKYYWNNKIKEAYGEPPKPKLQRKQKPQEPPRPTSTIEK